MPKNKLLEIEAITQRETDLVVLNRAPATVAAAVFYEGLPLSVHDYAMRGRFFLAVTDLAEEFCTFIKDFIQIKNRSFSLSEIDKYRLLRVIDFIRSELEDSDLFSSFSKKDYITDSSFRRNLERWIENIVNASIDRGKIVVSSQKQSVPQIYRETIGPFTKTEVETLAGFTKIRNISTQNTWF